MSILGGGPEIGFCTPSSGNVYESTASGTFDATRARCSINVGATFDTSSYAQWAFSASTATPNIGWMAYGARPDFGGEYEWVVVKDAAGTQRVAINCSRVDATGSLETYVKLYYYTGAAWVQVGSTIQVNMALQKWDLSINAAASGGVTLYINKTPRITNASPIDLSALASSANTLQVIAPHGNCYVSEVILADESTMRMRGRTDAITAAGPNTDWTGAYTDISEIVYTDATGITSAAANDVSTFTASSPTLEFTPLAVLVGARGALGSTGPTGLQAALRIGSTNYFSATTVQTAGYGAKVGIWNTDPSTSAAWGATNASAAKPGVKSIA